MNIKLSIRMHISIKLPLTIVFLYHHFAISLNDLAILQSIIIYLP